MPYISLARDRSKRPMRGSLLGDLIEGSCEIKTCAAVIHRGDSFVVFLGDRLMCGRCHEAGATLEPAVASGSIRKTAGTRAKRGGRPTKKEHLAALRSRVTDALTNYSTMDK